MPKDRFIPQPITKTLEENYMPYAMSVILSRAIPEIDGFKPSHRKLLYTMYKMGLLQGARTKSANVVGQTMRLNPHGDAAIYETMVRLARGNESLLTPFVDSKGNFGKVYSRDMAYAASRYTEVKLDLFCGEIFADIDCDAVDFVDNYDGTMKEPALLPTRFPNILVSANLGIAVGMASSICGFNLNEVCDTTIAYLKNPGCRLMDTLKGPDFPTGGELILDEGQMEEIYRTGRGSFRVRAKWNYLKKENIIEITEIPYTTTIEAIMDKVTDLIRQGKVREISDMRDESGLEGLKIAIDLKRGVDPQKLMAKLMKMTPLMDTFGCNFNVLIGGTPRVLGVGQLLEEWSAWRMECIRRRVYFDLGKKKEKLHLLLGLRKILLDIDRAIAIIRDTEEDSEVVPNLMIGFGIDELQAEYVAEIKLRNINKEHILKRTRETDELAQEIQELESILADSRKIKNIIIGELREINKKYKTPRRTAIIYEDQVEQYDEEDQIEDYPVHIFLTREGYFKKITPQSLRMSGEQKVKEGDTVAMTTECTNKSEIIFLTDKVQAYKCRLHEFDDGKASLLGDYLPQKLQMNDGERVIFCFLPGDYSGHLLYVYENGKVAKIPVKSFDTKSNRRRLTGAYCDKSPLVSVLHLPEEGEAVLYSTDSRALVVSTAAVAAKATRSSQGVVVMSLKKNKKVKKAVLLAESGIVNVARYRTRTLPAAGALLKEEDSPDKQLALEM